MIKRISKLLLEALVVCIAVFCLGYFTGYLYSTNSEGIELPMLFKDN